MKKLLLIDGHSILNRAFYGLPDLTNSEGIHTNAVLGFLNILMKLVEEENPTHLCVAFDVKQPTFRHLAFPEYKGTRKPMPEELRMQVPLMKEMLQAMGVSIVERGGYEADDIIGTLSRRGVQEDFVVTIVSGDRDLLQLATEDIQVRIPKTKQGGTTIENYYAKDVEERYGVNPIEFIDLKGLMGDTADNIPGVPGIGEKTATKIIQEYHSIENAFSHLEDIKPNKAKQNLETYYDQAILSKSLATIKLDCELDLELSDTAITSFYTDEAYKMCKRLEFKTLLKRFQGTAVKELDLQMEVVRDLATAELVFQEAMKEEQAGVALVIGEAKEVIALGICTDGALCKLLLCNIMMQEDFICERLSVLMKSSCHVCVLDLKRLLPYVSVCEQDKGITDLGLEAYLLNPMKDTYGYDDLARDFLGMTIPSKSELIGKELPTMMTIEEERMQKAAAYEAVIAYLTQKPLQEAIEQKQLKELYDTVELPTVYALYDMERNGIRVDKQALQEYGESLKERISELEQEITALAGHSFNINSPKQLGEVLFEELGLPEGKKTKTGYSTNAEVLEKLAPDYPIAAHILEYRQLTKLKSTYADGLVQVIREDGRIHGTFNQTITATGRISSTEPNLQNIPMRTPLGRAIRKVFIPEDGYVFVDADYSQIELRVLAHVANDQVMIQAFHDGLDIHTKTASDVFHVSMEDVTALQRRNAKAVNFGIVYGISAFGLSRDLQISRKEAADYITSYFESFPSIKRFLDQTVEQAKRDGMVRTICNRIRPIPELQSSNYMQKSFGERVAMNSPIQGSAADIIKIAMVRVNKRLKRECPEARLVLQIHDELLIEARKEDQDLVMRIVKEEMMHAIELQVPLEVDIHAGADWLEAK